MKLIRSLSANSVPDPAEGLLYHYSIDAALGAQDIRLEFACSVAFRGHIPKKEIHYLCRSGSSHFMAAATLAQGLRPRPLTQETSTLWEAWFVGNPAAYAGTSRLHLRPIG